MTRPTITFRSGGDMCDLHLTAMAALRKAGLKDQVRELHQRGKGVLNCHQMLSLVLEFVDVAREGTGKCS